ncbi:hypothetical protein NHX12_012698, partial [Muraenolepis orangiensis]
RSRGRPKGSKNKGAVKAKLSLSPRPGGQRTGVACVQFLSAFQIMANELSALFPSVPRQLRATATCRLPRRRRLLHPQVPNAVDGPRR